MRAGVLIIGSLLWDPDNLRESWRKSRLVLKDRLRVEAPIYYGKLSQSRNFTYTMVFQNAGARGHAVVVPCSADVRDLSGVTTEAQELWGAEAKTTAMTGRVGARWGCVGAAFRGTSTAAIARDWAKWFLAQNTAPVGEVDKSGLLNIPWPPEIQKSTIDILLATSTLPDSPRPTAEAIADAWIDRGSEHYFFQNVEHGIRTADDYAILSRFDARKAPFLGDPQYAAALSELRRK